MKFDEFCDWLRKEGFSTGDAFAIFIQFVSDLDAVTPRAMRKALPEFRGFIDFLHKYEEGILREALGE